MILIQKVFGKITLSQVAYQVFPLPKKENIILDVSHTLINLHRDQAFKLSEQFVFCGHLNLFQEYQVSDSYIFQTQIDLGQKRRYADLREKEETSTSRALPLILLL